MGSPDMTGKHDFASLIFNCENLDVCPLESDYSVSNFFNKEKREAELT